MIFNLFRKKKYHCIHCWRGYNKRELCHYCWTPAYTVDDIMKAAVRQLKEDEDAAQKVSHKSI